MSARYNNDLGNLLKILLMKKIMKQKIRRSQNQESSKETKKELDLIIKFIIDIPLSKFSNLEYNFMYNCILYNKYVHWSKIQQDIIVSFGIKR